MKKLICDICNKEKRDIESLQWTEYFAELCDIPEKMECCAKCKETLHHENDKAWRYAHFVQGKIMQEVVRELHNSLPTRE